jgi:ABC-type lipopolysaccharide export system ATPase subunit
MTFVPQRCQVYQRHISKSYGTVPLINYNKRAHEKTEITGLLGANASSYAVELTMGSH